MKILYIIDYLESNLPRDQNTIIAYMASRGHQVTVLTSKSLQYERFDITMFPSVAVIRAIKLFNIREAPVLFDPAIMKSLLAKYDIVHAFTFFTFSSVIATFSRRNSLFLRSEILDTHHVNFSKAKSGFYNALVKVYKKSYDKVLAYSLEEVKILRILGFQANQIKLLPVMINCDNLKGLENQVKEKLIIGTISRISPEKGVHELIRIFQTLLEISPNVDFQFVLAGRIGDQAYGRAVLTKLKKVLGAKFTYLGEVTPPQSFYHQVDVVIVPSLTETGAIVVLEAMVAGKTVIANNIFPINTYIKNHINGLIYDSPLMCAKSIEMVLSNPEYLKHFAQEARNQAQRHDSAKICLDLENEYLKALGK